MATVEKKTKEAAVKGEKKTPTGKYAKLIEQIAGLKVVELNDFVKELQNYFQINPAASFVGAASQNDASTEKKKKLFDLILNEVGQKKVAVIKLLSKITQKGLLEAKGMLNNLPLVVLSNKPESDLTKFQKEFQDAGAAVTIK